MVQTQEKPQSAPPAVQAKAWAPLSLRLPDEWTLSEQCLLELASLNDPWCFERSAEGALEIMPPPGPRSSDRGGRIYAQVLLGGDDLGSAFESSGGFRLADSSIRAPDVSWVSNERLAGIEVDHEGAWPVCPDFVVEIRSPSDRLSRQQAKMRQWMSNGARLGWLIDPFEDAVWVYREAIADPERIERPTQLDCGDILPNLVIDLSHVWR